MPRLTNMTRDVLDFIVRGAPKDGVPPTESIAPGETRDIDGVENATYHGRIAAGAVLLEKPQSRAAGKAD